jgi:CDP-diacylglycerol--serine O-phosphatidyltransferase
MSTPEQTKPRRRDLPLARLLPNMLTLLSLCSGLTGIQFAMMEKWDKAVLAIVLSSVFDVLDGRLARLLNIASKFGAELDSLADLTSFGVAPALMMYLWVLHNDPTGFGWIAALVFASCSALRLARFNTMLEDHTAPVWTKSFFTGVPAPAGAGLVLLPLIATLQFGPDCQPPAWALALWLIVIGGLMVSRVPTVSMKGRRVAPIWIVPIMLGVTLIAAALITNTWLALLGVGGVYLLLIPFGSLSYRRRMRQDQEDRHNA